MELPPESAPDTVQYPEWQKPLQEALIELDRDKLKQRVDAAEAAIFKRLQLLSHNSNHTAERQAIQDALTTLRFLKRDALEFPDWETK